MKSLEKRTRILMAARLIFLDQGFENANMDTVAKQAEVSKATVYNHFSSKEELFGTIVETECEKLLAPISSSDVDGLEVEEALSRLAKLFLHLALLPENLQLFRAVVAEVRRFPGPGVKFIEHGPERAITALAGYLDDQSRKENLSVPEPRYAAEQFFGMLMGFYHMRAACGETLYECEPDWSHHIRRTVAMFVREYAVGKVLQYD